MINNISIDDLNLIKENLYIIDIRSNEQYNSNHIPNAINIPQDKLILNPKKYLNYNDTYYIYCKKGKKSISLCTYLTKLGYKVINILGGYEKWLLKK